MNVDFIITNFYSTNMPYKAARAPLLKDNFLYISGDIGGSMGLFIGASVMTIYEIVDVILNYATETALRRIQRRKKRR